MWLRKLNPFIYFFDRYCPLPMTATLYRVQKMLDCKVRPFVKVQAAGHGEGIQGTMYLVTKIDFKESRMHYFNPLNYANMAITFDAIESLSIMEDQSYDLRYEQTEAFNNFLWRTHKSGKRGRHMRKRVGFDLQGHSIYVKGEFHIHKGNDGERAEWNDKVPFMVAALDLEHPDYDHPIAFTYYAIYGSLGINLCVEDQPWERCPRAIDQDAVKRELLRQEWEAYQATEPFQRGDIIANGNGEEQVFIRYLDEDRMRMVIYPDNMVEGITKVARYKLVSRQTPE